MKKIFTLLIISTSLNCYSQSKSPGSYILIRFLQQYDHSNKRDYYTIYAERDCDSAKDVYSLLYYNNNKNVIDTNDVYAYNKNDTTTILFNYFLSPTEGLNYMSKKGWNLITIYTEISSGYDTQNTWNGDKIPITTISSRPVFCFVKN